MTKKGDTTSSSSSSLSSSDDSEAEAEESAASPEVEKKKEEVKELGEKRKVTVNPTPKYIYFKNIDDDFMTAKLPKDPYDFISKRTQKIEINKGMPYKSTSADEVME